MTISPTTLLIDEDRATRLNDTDFFGDVVAELAQTLEETVGLSDAEGFIATVGENIGERISDIYDTGHAVTKSYIAQILVDLKDRIGGDFRVVEITGDKIILTNSRCPFGDRVIGKTSLCMMTTNVFGHVVADRNGYAHVRVAESIAENGNHCSVTVTLDANSADTSQGTEFFSG